MTGGIGLAKVHEGRALRLIKNFFYLSGAEIVSKLATFAAVAYLARVTGPAGLGYVEFAAAVLLCASMIVDQGFGLYGAREIARRPELTASLVTEIVIARFLLAFVAYGTMIAYALLVDHSPLVTQLLLIYGLSLLPAPLLLQWVFQGHNLMQFVAIIQVIRQSVYALTVFAFVRDTSQLWLVAVAEIAGVSFAATFGLAMYRRKIGGTLVHTLTLSRRLIREGAPIGLSQVFWMVRMFGATVIVGIIASPEDVGFFSAAMRILIALHAFIWLYFFNLLPSLAQGWQRGQPVFAASLRQSLKIIAWASVAGGTAWVLLSPSVVVGTYGPAFYPAAQALQWLAGVGVAAALSGHYRFGLIAAGHQNAEMLVSALGALVAVLLIPVGCARSGPSGAALGLFVAEVVVWGSAWWWARGRLGLAGHFGVLMRPLLAAAAAMGVLWLIPGSSPIVRVAIAVIVTASMALALEVEFRHRVPQLFATLLPWASRQLARMGHQASP